MNFEVTIWNRKSKMSEFEPVHSFDITATDHTTAVDMAEAECQRKGYDPKSDYINIIIEG